MNRHSIFDLPDELRPAIVFSFTLNAQGEAENLELARAVVRSRAQLNYPEVSEHLARERQQIGSGSLAGHEWSAALPLLEERKKSINWIGYCNRLKQNF